MESGELRMGDVAIRIKPGMEGHIEWRQHPSGRVPIFWRSGTKGVGESRTYIPTEFLQWLNPRARAWRDFDGKGGHAPCLDLVGFLVRDRA